mmetsp:Transcript_11211/g.27565  ORF Transcript_11211/g.27565 Transcript_11211/m.27565 type:complete len:186 (-) Transcript_11211:30-587(-)
MGDMANELKRGLRKLKKVDKQDIKITKPFYPMDDQSNEIFPRLFIGSIHAANNEDAMKRMGITHVFTLCPEKSPCKAKDIVYLKMEFLDHTRPGVLSEEMLKNILQKIDKILSTNANNRVLVHCLHGVSRSGTVCIAYVMGKTGDPFLEVWRRLKKIRSVIHPNDEFRQMLEKIEVQELLDLKQV